MNKPYSNEPNVADMSPTHVFGLNSVWVRPAVFVGLVALYLVTAPANHATALDSYGFAVWITETPIPDIPELRVFLWLVLNKGIFGVANAIAPGLDPFAFYAVFHTLQTALAVVLLDRLLRVHFGVSAEASIITALGFALSYGVWRYATEVEVYASVSLIHLALLYSAFSIANLEPDRVLLPLLALAVCGGLGTLSYQPIGIVAGFAIPAFLFTRLPFAQIVAYFAASGLVVFGGLFLIFAITDSGSTSTQLLDTDGKPLVIPGLVALAQGAVAFLQNVLSINWSFAFGPSREIFAQFANRLYEVWLYPAGFASAIYHVFLVTLPVAGVLFVMSIIRARKSAVRLPFSAKEGAVLISLLGLVAMVLLIDPTGFEPWLLTLVFVFILAGIRVIHPMVANGARGVGLGLIAVFLVHNWAAGVAVLSTPGTDFRVHQGKLLLANTDDGDLLVVGRNWALHRYLQYVAAATSVRLNELGGPATIALIEETFARGGSVVLVDDVVVLDGDEVRYDTRLGEDTISAFSAGGDRLDISDGKIAMRLAPK